MRTFDVKPIIVPRADGGLIEDPRYDYTADGSRPVDVIPGAPSTEVPSTSIGPVPPTMVTPPSAPQDSQAISTTVFGLPAWLVIGGVLVGLWAMSGKR